MEQEIVDAVTVAPIYLNSSFWVAIVAALALILSQLPPIYIVVKKAKIDFELYSKISLLHKVGNPNLQLHLIINNIGGRKVRVKGIAATVLRDGKKMAVLPAQNFLKESANKDTVLFTSFSLNPDDEWGHIVNLLEYFGREEEKRYRTMEGNIKSDIFEKQDQIKKTNGEVNELVEARPENVEPLYAFFDKKFIWMAGEYELRVKILTDVEKTNIEKSYKFTLFEYYEEELREITEKYKYGEGIYWEGSTPQGVIVDIKEA